ncbi:MAG TPA: hypothetical protein VGB28_05445 [Actinomycetota bacterium]|jgi:hypothetical protein
MSRRLTLPDLLILAGAGAYLGLSVAEGWFRVPATRQLGLELPEVRFDGWAAAATGAAAVAAAAAVAWVLLRLARGRPMGGSLDGFLASLGVILTALATVLPPRTAGPRPSPGGLLAAGGLAALLWALGGLLRWRGQARDPAGASGFGHP